MIITAILWLIINLIKVILLPIDALISGVLPSLDSAFTAIASLLTTIGSAIGWAISLSGISTMAIGLIVAYYVFALTVPLSVWLIKLVVGWYDKLKP